MKIAPASISSLRNDELFPFFLYLMRAARVEIRHDRASRYFQNEVLSLLAIAKPRGALLAILCAEILLVSELQQCAYIRNPFQYHIAARATVATGGPLIPFRLIKTDHASAAFPAGEFYCYIIDEH